VTISGTSFGGGEEWSTGFYIGNETADADLPNQQLADDIAAAWKSFFILASSYISQQFTTTLVKVSSVGTDGKSNPEDTMFATLTGAIGQRVEPPFPPQIALVATLTSAKARGVGAKGRMYLPGVIAPLEGNGHLTTSMVVGIMNNLKTFLNAVNASTATNNVVMLASHGSINKDGSIKVGGASAINKAVVGLRLGNVYDTQRRRRNGLSEAYQITSIP
jgi:hypothetical protein